VNARPGVPVFAAALWWGSLTAIGFLAVPLLFAHLPTPAQAGQLGARLFTAQSWLSLACGIVLAASARAGDAPSLDWRRGALLFVMAGVLLALLLEFAVAPRIVARENLRLWHTLGGAMYLAQWTCAAVVLWKVAVPAVSRPAAS
jgi:hypothetical protein